MAQAPQGIPSANPLLDFSGLPKFKQIRTEHVSPAIAELLEQCNLVLDQTTQDSTPATWECVVQCLDDVTERLGRAWGIVSHLHSVLDTPELRDTYNENLPRITEFWTRAGQDERLYKKYKDIAASQAYSNFSAARKKVIENALRDFRLGGAELTESQKPRYSEIQEQLAALSSKFSENVLDATNHFAHWISDENQLAGLPEDVIVAAKETAEQEDESTRKGKYKFTLHFPSYFPVLQYADHSQFRETMYASSAKRASEFGDSKWDNTQNIIDILKLRSEEAAILGFEHFADMSLVSKMAQTTDEVIQFLRELAQRARPYAEKDLAELQAFAAKHLKIEHLNPWDNTYVSEKLRQHCYSFSDNQVKQYFQEPAVLKGLFEITETLFNVQITADTADTWHKDVRFFTVSKNGQAIAHFYLDPYAREHKRGGAWMDDARGRKLLPEGLQTPVAYLTCNFPRPVGGKAATLSHDDVLTLFHEFGHGLHHMLTQVEELGVAGINGVEWDAVELPSQFMENFAWEWSVVSRISSHIDTGEPLPKALFDKMLAAKNFQSGLHTLRQIEFSLFDMLLHSQFDANGTQTVLDLLTEVRQQVAVIFPPAYHRFPHSFTHIFAGGYCAGYYSYKWAEVLSADAYEQFEETGVLNPLTGEKFWQEILAMGGSRPAAESFKAFRGRAPTIDALLRHSGMKTEKITASL